MLETEQGLGKGRRWVCDPAQTRDYLRCRPQGFLLPLRFRAGPSPNISLGVEGGCNVKPSVETLVQKEVVKKRLPEPLEEGAPSEKGGEAQ